MISYLEIFFSLSRERRFTGPENFSEAQGGREEKRVENHWSTPSRVAMLSERRKKISVADSLARCPLRQGSISRDIRVVPTRSKCRIVLKFESSGVTRE